MNKFEMVHVNAARTKQRKRQDSWWREIDSETWQDLYEVSQLGITPHGESETSALRNIYYQSRIVTGKWRVVLSELEQQVLDMFTFARRNRGSGYDDTDICRIVAASLVYVTPSQVKSIMRDVEMIQRNIVMLEDAEYEANAIHVEFKKLVKEVMIEEMDYADDPAA